MTSSQQIIDAYVDAGIPKGTLHVFGGDELACAQPSWLSGEFGSAFNAYLFSSKIVGRPGKFECPQFAVLAVGQASVCWLHTPNTPDVKLAIGIMDCIELRHMVVTAPYEGVNGKLIPSFYEATPGYQPTLMQPLLLTREQLESCTACIFF